MTEEEEFEFRRRLEAEKGAPVQEAAAAADPRYPVYFADSHAGAARYGSEQSKRLMGRGKQGDTMGDIHRAREGLVYEAGGRVTDLTGSPALGAAANVAVDMATDPLSYVGAGVGKAIQPAAKLGAKKLMWSALKPDKKARMSGDAAKAVQTLLDEGVNVTKGGAEKLTARIDELDDALDAVIATSTAKLKKTEPLKQLKGVLKEYREGTLAAGNLDEIRNVARSLIDHPLLRGKSEMSVQTAQAMKRQNYKELGDAAYSVGLKPSSQRDALKAVTRGLKEEIERLAPEAGAINREMGPLVNARDLVQDRVLVAGNKNPLGWSVLNPKTALLALADRSEITKSILARLLHESAGYAPVAGSITGVAASNLPDIHRGILEP